VAKRHIVKALKVFAMILLDVIAEICHERKYRKEFKAGTARDAAGGKPAAVCLFQARAESPGSVPDERSRLDIKPGT
jgi:hypothetical protein